jgi:hypothetical protein
MGVPQRNPSELGLMNRNVESGLPATHRLADCRNVTHANVAIDFRHRWILLKNLLAPHGLPDRFEET